MVALLHVFAVCQMRSSKTPSLCQRIPLSSKCIVCAVKVSASSRNTVVVTRGVSRGSGLQPVNEVFCWGLGNHVPTRINFNNAKDAASPTRWQTHDARIDIVDVAAARCHNIALDRIGRVFSWGFGADNLGARSYFVEMVCPAVFTPMMGCSAYT